MSQQVEDAINHLKKGEFEKSKQIYSNLLDYSPNEKDYIAGFYISSYWDNRLDQTLSTTEGKDRGLLLSEFFEKFEQEYFKRNYPRSYAYDAIEKCILEESCIQLKFGFQKLGPHSFGKENYLILAKNLLRIEDYKNCLDILDYSKKFLEITSDYYYYKAECLYHLNEAKKSRLMFRSTMLYFTEKIPISLIKSEPIASAWNTLLLTMNKDEALYYLPVYCLERNLFPEINDYSKEEILNLWKEIQELLDALLRDTIEKTYKVRYTILHYGLTILDSFYGQINVDLSRKVENILEKLDPSILERRLSYKNDSQN